MSIAIVNTKNTMGVRTLGGYVLQSVPRGPAEPGPRLANHPVRGIARYGLGAVPNGFLLDAPGRPTKDIVHYMAPPMPGQEQQTTPTSTPPQNPTGSAVSSYTELSAAIAPSVATMIAPAANPTSIATVAPSTAPGYVVVNSGAAASPDYVSEIEAWLTSTTLLASISPSLAIPNWIPALVIAVGTMYMLKGKK